MIFYYLYNSKKLIVIIDNKKMIIILLLIILILIKCDDKVYKVRRDKANNITNSIIPDGLKVEWCLKILKENHIFPGIYVIILIILLL